MKVRRIQALHGMPSAACYSLLQLRGIEIGQPRAPWIPLQGKELTDIQMKLREVGLPI